MELEHRPLREAGWEGDEAGPLVPPDRDNMWSPKPDKPADFKLSPRPAKSAMASSLRPIPKPKPPPLDAEEKKFAAKFAVRQGFQRIGQYMERTSAVYAAEEREAATKGSSADVGPTASALAALTFPLPVKLNSRLDNAVAALAAHRKRKRDDEDDDGDETDVDEAHDAKRRRVRSNAPSPSPPEDRPTAGKPVRESSTGATATKHYKQTTSAASRVPRTALPATLKNCPPPPRGATVVGNKKVEQALMTPPTLGRDCRVPLKRELTPPPTPPSSIAPAPRQLGRKIPFGKPAAGVTAGAADAPSTSKAPPRLARKIPFYKPAAVEPAAAPNLPPTPPSTSNASSAGLSMPATPTSNAPATPRPARKIPFYKPPAAVVTAAAPNPPSNPPSTPNASSAGPSTLATPRLARQIPFYKPAAVEPAAVAVTASPNLPSTPPSTSNASSAGPSTPAPVAKPPVRVPLSRKPASVFAGGTVSSSAPTPSPSPSSSPRHSPTSAHSPQPSPTFAPMVPPPPKIVARLPATAYGPARVSREVLPAPPPKHVPVVDRRRWNDVVCRLVSAKTDARPAKDEALPFDDGDLTPPQTPRLLAAQVPLHHPRPVVGGPSAIGLARAVEASSRGVERVELEAAGPARGAVRQLARLVPLPGGL